MDKKRLLIISSLFPNPQNPNRGTFVLEQVLELARDYEVRVIAHEISTQREQQRFIRQGITVDYLRYPLLLKAFPSALITFRLFCLPHIRRIVQHWKPNLVHIHDYAHIPALYWLGKWIPAQGIDSYLTLHNLKSLPGQMNHPSTDFIYASTLGKALSPWKRIFIVSNKLQDVLAKYNPRIEFIGNGIRDIEPELSPESGIITGFLSGAEFSILSVGNLIETKGFSLLIAAVANLKTSGLDIRLVIVGEGPQRAQLIEQCKRLGIEDNTLIHNQIENKVLRGIYAKCDLFVLPSFSETFGIVYLEAMYAGVPVVAVKGEGIWGLFEEDREALYAEPRSITDLEAKIRYVIANPKASRELADRAQLKVRKDFMLDKLVSRLQAHYEKPAQSKRCIMHIPWQLIDESVSASEIRPIKMLQAFQDNGYEVFFVTGDAKTRQLRINQLKQNLASGIKYDFLYSESSTLPMMLTDTHHLPTRPFTDLKLFSLCKRNSIPIGLFYRDMHWAFPQIKRFGNLKHKFSKLFHLLELQIYNRFLCVFFSTSKDRDLIYNHLSSLDQKLPYWPLYPGTDLHKNFNPQTQDYFVFIGSVRPPLYDIRIVLQTFNMFPHLKLKLCTAKAVWELYANYYKDLVSPNVEILHLVNEDAQNLIAHARYALNYFPDFDYRNIAMPFKIFDYMSHDIPVICNVNDATGKFMSQTGIGFAIPHSVEALTKFLSNLPDEEEYQEMRRHISKCKAGHTWQKRAEFVASTLTAQRREL